MTNTAYICVTCGVQYAPAAAVPLQCKICEDDRQYVHPNGQQWTTLDELNRQHYNMIAPVSDNLFAVYSLPDFAIHQRAHVLLTPGGNILWDCISNIDEATIARMNELGGLRAIAVSHPHYFSTIIEWSNAFGGIPIYINALDSEWLTYTNDQVQWWDGPELALWDDIRLIRCGGHFPGANVLFNPAAGGQLLVGDVIQVTPTLRTVSFMYSYPNMIPLPKKDILQIRDAVIDKDFDAMYGAFGKYILQDAKGALERSVDRYLQIFE